jgi:hypothetical protein
MESHCDNFAKELGYGKELASAVSLLECNTKVIEVDDSLYSKAYDVYHRVLYGYPSTNTRIANLNESEIENTVDFSVFSMIDNFLNRGL